MKYLRRFCCVLLCFVLLLVGSSVNVFAAESEKVGTYLVDFRAYIMKSSDNSTWKSYNHLNFDPDNVTVDTSTYAPVYIGKVSDLYVQNKWYFFPQEKNPIISKGGEVTTLFLKCQATNFLQYMNSSQTVVGSYYDRTIENVQIQLVYTDGTYDTISGGTASVVNTNQHTFEITFTPAKDVERFTLITINRFQEPSVTYSQVEVNIYFGDYFNTEQGWDIYIQKESTESGLLSGISNWIKNVYNKVTDTFENVKNGFTNVGTWLSNVITSVGNWFTDLFTKFGNWFSDLFTKLGNWFGDLGELIRKWFHDTFNKIGEIFYSVLNGFTDVGQWFVDLGTGIGNWFVNLIDNIVSLPKKIWNFICDGLKSLFVPAEDFIVDFKDDLNELLEEKFGAVYQVFNLLTDSFSNIENATETKTINIPKTTIKLPAKEKFSFGGYNVKIVPDGFEWLATSLKWIVGIICTLAFINGMRKKFDDVME